jgi:NAD(P)-dependent dehydrogenase (short-subunit alcohol dehydrogenase family)
MKNVFLTGASSGIGLATARLLVAQGHEVWGTSRDEGRLPALPHFHPVQLDLRQPAAIADIVRRTVDQAGHLDVLINNAGSGRFGPAESFTVADLADEFQVLVFSQIQLMQLALAHMRPRHSGLIINVTSLASRLPVPFMSAYNAAKAAMASFTMTTQLELPGSGIHLVDLQPADISTRFNDAVTRTPSDPAYAAGVDRTWHTVDQNMKAAPKPELVAREILRLMKMNNPPPQVTAGAFFQAGIAPLLFRLLPQRTRVWGLKKYYRL